MGVWEGEGKEREERGGQEAEAMEVDEGPPPPPLPDAPMATAEGAKQAAAEQQQQHWVDGGELTHPGPWKPSTFKYSDLPTLAQLAHDADGADGAALKNVQVDSYPCTQVGAFVHKGESYVVVRCERRRLFVHAHLVSETTEGTGGPRASPRHK